MAQDDAPETRTPREVRAEGAPRPDRVRTMSVQRLRGLLEASGVPWFVDHEGDLGILWRRGTVRVDVWNSADRPAVVLLSATWHRRPTIERLASLMALADQWNATSEGVKTYVRVLDDGDLLVCFERALMVRRGASDAQSAGFLQRTMAAVFDRVAELEALFPDPVSRPEDEE